MREGACGFDTRSGVSLGAGLDVWQPVSLRYRAVVEAEQQAESQADTDTLLLIKPLIKMSELLSCILHCLRCVKWEIYETHRMETARRTHQTYIYHQGYL